MTAEDSSELELPTHFSLVSVDSVNQGKNVNVISHLLEDIKNVGKEDVESEESPSTVDSCSVDNRDDCVEPATTNLEKLEKEAFDLLEEFFDKHPALLTELVGKENDSVPVPKGKSYPRKCRICRMSFKTQKEIDNHKMIHFEMDRSFKCKYCRKLFFDKRNLKTHEKNHEEGQTYQCVFCLRSFRKKEYHDKHILIHDASLAKTTGFMKEGRLVE